MKKLNWKFTRDKKLTHKEWESPLLPFLYTFKILGRFPFHKDESGGLGFRLVSAPSVWALVATFFQFVVVIQIYVGVLTDPKNWASFTLTITSWQELVILYTTFYTFSTWSETPAITRAFNRWRTFHKKFHTTTGRKVVSPVLSHSYWGIICSFVLALTMFGESMFKDREEVYLFEVFKVRDAAYSICVFYFTVNVFFWVVYCLTVQKAAEILKEYISQQITITQHILRATLERLGSHIPNPRFIVVLVLTMPKLPQLQTSQDLAKLRSLWVELHGCTVEMTTAIGNTIFSNQVVSYLLTLFSLYAVLMYVLADKSLHMVYIQQALVHSHLSCILVYTFGHLAQQSMTENMLFLLYSKRWHYLNLPGRIELEILLDAIETSTPCFEIKGLLTMNRCGYVEVLNRILTYLIILVQIKVTADGAT